MRCAHVLSHAALDTDLASLPLTRTADVTLIPSRSWSTSSASSSSDPAAQPSLLGLTLRPCAPHLALSSVWHILDILESSPAESAGLVPFGDYVIGWAGGVLRNEGDFYELVESHEGRPLRLYVYNADYDHTREVIIVPNREWGGEGLLGCGVGFGLLHRIPRPQDRPNAPPGEQQMTASDSAPNMSTSSSAGSGFGASAPGGFPTSSTDPNLAGYANHHSGSGSGEPPRIPAVEEDDDDEEDDEYDVSHTSGVTVSMRRDEED